MKALKTLGWMTVFVLCWRVGAAVYHTSPWLAYVLSCPILFLPRPWVR
jgi:hypothetical protein